MLPLSVKSSLLKKQLFKPWILKLFNTISLVSSEVLTNTVFMVGLDGLNPIPEKVFTLCSESPPIPLLTPEMPTPQEIELLLALLPKLN